MTRTVVRPAVVLLAVLAATAACGTKTGATDPVAADPTSPAPSPSEPTETPSSSPTADPSPTATPERPASLKARLLDASRLPGFNEEMTWANGETTSSESPELAATCHKFEMTSIGAEEVASRTYDAGDGMDVAASELVAELPDSRTAKRAYAVLAAWREQCAEDGRKVGDFVPLDLGKATGGWYLVTYGETFDAIGFARQDNHIAVLSMKLVGQDYDYPPGEEPMVTALTRAASLLG